MPERGWRCRRLLMFRLKLRARQLLCSANSILSSKRFLCSSETSIAPSNRQPRRQPKQLTFLLQKHPSSRQVTQQVHCYTITSGLLSAASDSDDTRILLLFNTLLHCYSRGEFSAEAFLLLGQYQLPFDSYTYTALLNTCVDLGFLVPGVQLHGIILKSGFEDHVYVQTALVRVYAAHGSLTEAAKVFGEMPERNSVTWNVLITGFVNWKRLDAAFSLFESMPSRTIVSWTVMIDGYTRMNRITEAFGLFRRMSVDDGIKPSEITILAIVPAVSNLRDMKICQSVHCYGEKRGFNAGDIRVMNSLIDSYAKCGCIISAWRLFENITMERKNLVSWTSIIAAFAMHGMGKEAVENFKRLEATELKPNRVTFLSVLNACSHGGLVEEGLTFFEKMIIHYQIEPDIKHYGSLIDMLGRAGRLEEAEKIALEVPTEIANDVIWRTLLGACSFHGDVEMGERVTKKILEIEREYGGDYVLMSNIFTGVGRFEDAERLREQMDETYASKLPGHSII